MPDKDLIDRLKDPDVRKKAFNELVDLYQQKLYWHIRRMVINHDDADDVLQNTFIKIWRNIDGFREESSLYTWVYKIATNESITFLNQRKRLSIVSSSDSSMLLVQRLESDTYFEGDEIQKNLQIAISRLPDKQRQVFLLKYYDEMKYEEMSNVLGTSVGALKASYHHAVKKIEDYFNALDD